MKIKIKICGLARVEDLMVAAAAGADYAGFVFAAGSPRQVTPEQARSLIGQLPAKVIPVGVFVDADPSEIERIVAFCGLRIVQMHGSETAADIERLHHCATVWKAVALHTDKDLQRCDAFPVEAMVVDNMQPGRPGGTGCTGDWRLAARLARRRRIVLAGGLNPDNVAQAARMVRPFGVDVASGVELQPGIKDHDKVRAFCAALGVGSK